MTSKQIEGENKEYKKWRLSLIDKNTGIVSPIDAWFARAEEAEKLRVAAKNVFDWYYIFGEDNSVAREHLAHLGNILKGLG